MTIDPRQRRAARRAPATSADSEPTRPKPALTPDRITDAALEIVAARGYEALTMRRVAEALDTGPASLYAHVVNKADLDELIIGRLCNQIELPTPDPDRWREQITAICVQLRDQYLRYPGISRAGLAMDVTDLEILRVNEGMLAILITGGVAPRTAAWAIDALFLYIGAYTLEVSLVQPGGELQDDWRLGADERDTLRGRLTALPEDRFPQIRAHADELTSGGGHERFDFTVNLMIGGLA